MSYDTSQTTETQLWIDNDESLHRRKWFCFANLAKKVRKGIFDAKKAEKLFRYLCDEAARLYKKEIGTPLAMDDRRQAEKDLVTDFIAHSRLDSFPADLEANIKPPMAPYVARREAGERRAHLGDARSYFDKKPPEVHNPRAFVDDLSIQPPINPTIAPGRVRSVFVLYHNGKAIFESPDENAVYQHLHKIQGQSIDYALKHGGYSIKNEIRTTPGAGKHDPAGHKPTMIVASPPPAESIRAYAKRQARKGDK